ncbi:FUSC family protein [Shewanella aestuarii]|uniref:FUSC family protein n=1 Tax=Shewanella aestuarii TaxID=1028752 RepID=A0A6G9QLP2_9GAMM|nr:FUSC family protein [Shewanella aestuarii]QIR15500.1 hypothetical protein HBH39_14175 [Shewanella aestuarii]
MEESNNKIALKMALAVVLSICCALWLQWEKPYWSAMAALVMGMSESIGHAITKGRHRLLGTGVGIIAGLFLIVFLSQERFMFLAILCVILAICVFMTSDPKYGYIYSTTFTVCIIIASVGGFDNQVTFNVLLLRLQETLLGIVVYTLVFRIIWPRNTETLFLELFTKTQNNLVTSFEEANRHLDAIMADGVDHHGVRYKDHSSSIRKLYEYLNMPFHDRYQLHRRDKQWREHVKAMAVAQHCLAQIHANWQNPQLILRHRMLLKDVIDFLQEPTQHADKGVPCPRYIQQAYDELPLEAKADFLPPKNYRLDAIKSLKALCMFITALMLWIYVPIPDSYMFPLNAGVYAGLLAPMPDRMLKHWMLGYFGFGVIFIVQYVLIMPAMTEVWQLAAFYFINTYMLWRVMSHPRLVVHRIIGGNIMLLMTAGALNNTPTFDVESSIIMLIYIMLSFVIVQFYTHLFSGIVAKLSAE